MKIIEKDWKFFIDFFNFNCLNFVTFLRRNAVIKLGDWTRLDFITVWQNTSTNFVVWSSSKSWHANYSSRIYWKFLHRYFTYYYTYEYFEYLFILPLLLLYSSIDESFLKLDLKLRIFQISHTKIQSIVLSLFILLLDSNCWNRDKRKFYIKKINDTCIVILRSRIYITIHSFYNRVTNYLQILPRILQQWFQKKNDFTRKHDN